jgi:hypothetical protein
MVETQVFELMTLHKAKQPCQKKLPQQIVEFAHINTLVALYNCNFSMYNIGKKHGTQLIPNVV